MGYLANKINFFMQQITSELVHDFRYQMFCVYVCPVLYIKTELFILKVSRHFDTVLCHSCHVNEVGLYMNNAILVVVYQN
jgi:hypothetical protein